MDAPDIIISSRGTPLCKVPHILFGSKPTDGGNLILTHKEMEYLIEVEPKASEFIKTYLSAEEFINNNPRYCLWLKGCPPERIRKMPKVLERVEKVQKFRSTSTKEATRKDASRATVFAEDRQPSKNFLAIPKTSSERRNYIPIGFMTPDVVVASELFTIEGANIYHFGVLTSSMHMAWVRSVCGRLKSDYRYSAGIVYNNFPWPEAATDKQRQSIEVAAQAVLDARAKYPDSSLADLYDPLTMPPELVKAHHKIDAAVDAAYSKKKFFGDSDRVAFLFEQYQQITSPLESKKTARRVSKPKTKEEV